jgi:hypothetical protein
MIQIPAVIERCAGIDVGKREIAVAIITGPADQDGEVKTRALQPPCRRWKNSVSGLSRRAAAAWRSLTLHTAPRLDAEIHSR